MTRVVVFGDSLPLPRPEEEGGQAIWWEETWPWRLQRVLARLGHPNEVINCSARDRTVEAFATQAFEEHIAWKMPNVLIIELGIVDCGPRIFSRMEKRLMNLPGVPGWLRERIIELRVRRRAEITSKDPLAKVMVRPETFREHIEAFGRRLSELRPRPQCWWVPILLDPVKMEQKSPGFSKNVELYNRIIRDLADRAGYRWVEHATAPEDFWVDGYHLSATGNARLADTLGRLLATAIATSPQMPRRFGSERPC